MDREKGGFFLIHDHDDEEEDRVATVFSYDQGYS